MAQKQIQPSLRDIRNRIDQLFNEYQTQPDSPVLIDTFLDDLSGILAEFQGAGGETGLADLARFPEENLSPVMRIDRDGTILYANSASSIILKEWDRQTGQQMPREWASRIRKVARSGEKQILDLKIGDQWFSFLLVPIQKSGYVNVYGREITERKQAEESLRKSESKFMAIFQKAPMAIALSSLANGELIDVNEAFEQIFGFKKGEAIGRTSLELGIAPEAQAREQLLTQLKQTGFAHQIELFYRNKTGDTIALFGNIDQVTIGTEKYILSTFENVTERKQAEEAQRISEYKFSILFTEASLPAVLSRLSDHVYVDVNDAWVQLFGFTKEEVDGKTSVELGILRNEELRADIIREDLPRYPVHDLEQTLFSKSGEAHIVLTNINVIEIDGQEYALTSVHDITDRKQVEAKLTEKTADLQEAQRIAQIGNWSWDAKTDTVTGSDELYRIYGLDPATQTLPAFKDQNGLLYAPETWERLNAAAQETLRTGAGYQLDIETVRGGQPIWITMRAEAVRNHRGQILGLYGTVQDITERKVIEDQLRHQAEILELIQDAIVETDLHFQITSWNPAAERIYGWRAEEVIGKLVKDILRTVLTDEQREAAYRDLEDGETVVLEHVQPIREDQKRIIEGYAIPMRDSVGKASGYVSVTRDVTEKKQVEAVRRLNRTLKALGDSRLAMMRAEDETSFLNDVCRIVVEDCGHAMAWIGFAEEDAAKSVRPVAHAGYSDGFIEKMNLTWADTERGRGPTGTAIRTEKPSLSRHILTDPRFEPWRADALQRGYASSIVLPILSDGNADHSGEGMGRHAFGAIAIFSREPDPFSEDEVRLLSELANDLGYGISAIRMKAARRRVEAALRRNEAEARVRAAELETMMNTAPAIVWMSRDPECGQMVSNKYGYDFLKVPPGSNISMTAPSEDRPMHLTARKDGVEIPPEEMPMQVAARTGVAQYGYEYDVVFENGATYHLYGNATPLFDEQGRPSGAVGIFVDITERTRAEAETRRLGAELEIRHRLLEQREQERLKIARDLHDGPVQELTAATFVLHGLVLGECSQGVASQLKAVQASLKAQIQELRDYAGELRPPSLSKFGLEKTLRLHAEAFQEKHPEMQIQLEIHFTGNLLPDPIRLALFRIYQQALANIVKHSQASEVHVQLIKDEQLGRLEIRDNGQGFVLPKEWLDLVRQGHLGLVGMRERAEAVGGRLEVHSQPGRGTQIQVVVPLQGQEAASKDVRDT